MAQKHGRDREATKQRLIDAALEVMERDGPLAGVNLREVAESAGVTRANVYHYFGSRQELIRAAINQHFDTEGIAWLDEARDLPFVERKMRVLMGPGGPRLSTLLALLVVDGDESVDPMPDFEHSISDLRNDVIKDDLERDLDLEALQVATASLRHGYNIFRSAYAARVGVSVEQMDERFAAISQQVLEGFVNRARRGGLEDFPAATDE